MLIYKLFIFPELVNCFKRQESEIHSIFLFLIIILISRGRGRKPLLYNCSSYATLICGCPFIKLCWVWQGICNTHSLQQPIQGCAARTALVSHQHFVCCYSSADTAPRLPPNLRGPDGWEWARGDMAS